MFPQVAPSKLRGSLGKHEMHPQVLKPTLKKEESTHTLNPPANKLESILPPKWSGNNCIWVRICV